MHIKALEIFNSNFWRFFYLVVSKVENQMGRELRAGVGLSGVEWRGDGSYLTSAFSVGPPDIICAVICVLA